MITILLADDHIVVRMGLATLLNLEEDMRVVAQAENTARAVALFQEFRPAIVIMDVRMPGESGIDAVRQILILDPGARVVMLTTYDTEQEIQAALGAGAVGYLLKTTGREELLQAVRRAHAGTLSLSRGVSARLAEARGARALSPREMEVLHLIYKGMTNKEIAAILVMGEETVKTHVRNMMQKLEASDRTEAVGIAIERGILRVG